MLILALLACGGPPDLTFGRGVCAETTHCDVPLGSNILLEPLLDGEPTDQIEIETSDRNVVVRGKSASASLALWRTVAPGRVTLTLRAGPRGEEVERTWVVQVHAIADLGLEAPTGPVHAGEVTHFVLRPTSAAGEVLVWDSLFLDQGEPDMLCNPKTCPIRLPMGTHSLWNGELAPPLEVVVGH